MINIPKKKERSVREFDLLNSEGNEIKSYKTLKKRLLNKRGEIHGKKTGIIDFLDRIKNMQNEDPVLCLYNLYRTGLSIKVICIKFGYKADNLEYLFKEILNWKLRDSNDKTPSGIKRKEASSDISGLKKNWKTLYDDTLNKYNNTLNSILEPTEKNEKKYDSENFNKLNGKYRKIIYIISIKFKRSIEDTIELLHNLKEAGFSAILIAREINKELNFFFNENSDMYINISDNDIRDICNNFDYKKYKKDEFNIVELGKVDEKVKIDSLFRLDVQILRNVKGIKSRRELEELQKNTPESSKRILTNRLDRLALTLKKIYINKGIDPIKFLIYLYYEKKLSMGEVSKYLENLGIEWPRSSLENQKELFGWEVNIKT